MEQEVVPPSAEAPGCRVRQRAGSEVDACVEALAEVHERDGYPQKWPEDPGAWLTPPSLLAAWVAERDGAVVGHVALTEGGAQDRAPEHWSPRSGAPAGTAAVVSRLFVSPAARGHGVGALLMERVADEARRRGLHPVLDVLTSDASAIALYESLGWTRLATVDQRWGPDQTVTVHCYAAPAAPGPARADVTRRSR
ncbi:GNAT family N-acetyltransferase [Streptomyces sp. BBFR102]|uniref:GNAT family N-acetyltransferase n=1 Tax=Streptomyces sp. BBFR102 TaxID=3448171 RepID=UPI003F53C293